MKVVTMRVAALAMAAGMLAAPVVGHGAEPDGEMLALSCFSCHGTDGKSPGAIPAIYGKSAEFVAKALKEFKSGERVATVMNRLSKGYTDAEIRALAEYFGSLK